MASAALSVLIGDIRYVKLILLLMKVGTPATKKLLLKCSTSDKKCIDDYLKDNEDKLKKKLFKNQIDILFPGPTDLERWDITLLTFILLYLFDKKLDSREKSAIRVLREKKNEIQSHSPSTIMSEERFSRLSCRLIMVFSQLTSGLTTAEQEEINDTVEDILSIQDFHMAKQQLTPFEEYDEFVKKVISEISKSFEQNLIDHDKRLSELEVFKDKLQPLLDIQAIITVSGSSPTATDTAQAKLLDGFKTSASGIIQWISKLPSHLWGWITERGQNGEEDEVQTAIEHLSKDIRNQGVEIVKVEKGSILVTFRCPTISALRNISKYIFNRMFEERLLDLEKALGKCVKSPIMLNISIVLETLHTALMEIEKEANKSIVLTLRCRGSEGVKKAIDCFGNRSSTNALNSLSEALSRSVNNGIELHTKIDADEIENVVTELEHKVLIYDQQSKQELTRQFLDTYISVESLSDRRIFMQGKQDQHNKQGQTSVQGQSEVEKASTQLYADMRDKGVDIFKVEEG